MRRRKSPSSNSSSKLQRVRALPWAALAQAAVVIARRWFVLSPEERARLARLARDSQGRPGRLSRGQRAELHALIGKLEVSAVGRELLALARGRAGGGRCRRRR